MEDPASLAITQLYNSSANEFARRLNLMTTNMRRALLEDFRDTPNSLMLDTEEILSTLSSTAIKSQVQAADLADITNEQRQDFGLRLENNLADAITVLRDCFATFGDRTSIAFQLEAASLLDVPVS